MADSHNHEGAGDTQNNTDNVVVNHAAYIQDKNLMTVILMLNDNINTSKAEIMHALEKHEEMEMGELAALRLDIQDLQTWKWRLVGLLGATVLLGLVQQDTIQKIGSLGGLIG